ncbi:MAG: ABC transporter substrate-binding protein [Thermomicrobiales bacterium]|nr:ABC transporter substrate-binding protein [Thermomicrobiales bacterium]
MSSQITRRSLLKGSAAALATIPAIKASSVFAAPAFLKQTGPIEVLYWGAFSGALGEAEKTIVDQFNAGQTDVKVNYETYNDYESLAQKLTASLAGGAAPDIALLSDVWWFKFYLAEALAPLNDFIAANEVDIADFQDSLIVEGYRDETYWWMPFARSTPLFYYNKEAFAAAGLTEAPKTWDELIAAAPAIVTKDGDTITRSAFAHPSAGSYIAWLFQGVVWQYGGVYSDADFNIKLNEEGAVKAGELYRASVQDGWATTPADINTDFLNGLTASMMASTGGLAGLTKDATFEFGTAFLPQAEQFGCCTGGAGLSILAGSAPKKQEAAFKFIEFITSPESTAWWSQNTGYMPTRKSAVTGESMQAFFAQNPNFKVAVDQLAQTKPQDAARVFIPGGDQIIGKGLERITINGEEVQPVFDEVAQELKDEAEPVLEALAALQ